MHSATRLDDLKILECFLQNSLHAHLGRIIPFRVQCLYKDETLWVLAQHPADVVLDIPDTFRVLERALQAEEPKTPLAVKLYLRAEGNQRPYSQQSFTVYPLVQKIVPGEAAPAMTGMSEDQIALESDLSGIKPGKPQQIEVERGQPQPPTVTQGVVSLDDEHERFEEPEDRIVKIDTDAFVSDIENSFGTSFERDSTIYPRAAKPRHKLIPILGGLGALAIGSGAAYMGTRPCVLQSVCTELTTATQLAQTSFATVNNPAATGREILTAQQQLHQSVDNLNAIPAWAGSHSAAQQSLQVTAPQVEQLDTTVAAMNKAYRAASIVKNPPIPLAKWEESRQMWTESIAALGKVPSSSKVYPLAQQKLTDYQGKLADIQRRIGIETSSEEKLKSAAEGIKSATQSQAAAKSLAEWRGVKTQWDKVSDALSSIPSTTTVYAQAQTLLKSAQPQIATATEKVQEEDKATQNYNNAVELAKSAKLAQKNNQFTEAVAQWNQSVVAIQSIPQNSAVYSQAKPLVFEYTKSFQQAEEQLKTSQKIALANKDLQETCAGTPQRCSYTVTAKGITVRLMPLYTQTVMQTAQSASLQGDSNAKMGIVNHVSTLGNALQTISDNVKLPLEVYGADGKQIQSYRPQG
jgi:tetratricopeptide (TPR) repeat protein